MLDPKSHMVFVVLEENMVLKNDHFYQKLCLFKMGFQKESFFYVVKENHFEKNRKEMKMVFFFFLLI